jgi:hypothetical protein
MGQHDSQTGGANDSSEFPDSDVALSVGRGRHEEDDQRLVEGVHHVHPERVGAINLKRMIKFC